jgi:hypothetical protein
MYHVCEKVERREKGKETCDVDVDFHGTGKEQISVWWRGSLQVVAFAPAWNT